MGLYSTRTLSSLLLTTAILIGHFEVSMGRQSHRAGRHRPIRVTQCQTLARFRVGEVEPLTLTRGDVTLAALLTNTCSFCLAQASRLQNMSSSGDYDDVRMMIINGGSRPPEGEEGALEQRVTFPVYHDDSAGTIWSLVFGGRKDDIYLIDRCGQLTYRLPFPYSYLGYNYVSRAIERTRSGNVCPCQLPSDQDPHDRMMGDAPSISGGFARRSMGSRLRGRGHSWIGGYGGGDRRRGPSSSYRYHNRSRRRCARDDQLCRDMRRDMRRYKQFARQHGLGSLSLMPEEQALGYFGYIGGGRGGGMGPAA